MKGRDLHWGTGLDAFLAGEGIREVAKAGAVTRVVAWQLSQEMGWQVITRTKLAALMHTNWVQG